MLDLFLVQIYSSPIGFFPTSGSPLFIFFEKRNVIIIEIISLQIEFDLYLFLIQRNC